MPEIPLETQKQLFAVLRRHQRALRRRAGVTSVGVGYAFKNGKPTNDLGLVAVVTEKLPRAQLARRDVIPARLEGKRVDVIEGPSGLLISPTSRFDPVRGGIQIQAGRGAGTLGCIVFSANLSPCALTCEHVVIPLGTKPIGSVAVFQPELKLNDALGRYIDSDTKTDSALVSLPSDRLFSTGILNIVTAPSKGTLSAVVGMRVKKTGRTTETTQGIITFISAGVDHFCSVYPDRTIMPPSKLFAARGDSGSLLVERNTGCAVGLIHRGSSDPNGSISANLIGAVCKALNCSVYDEASGVLVADPGWIGGTGIALILAAPGTRASLRVIYPSGRVSGAKGLGSKRADRNGVIRWTWTIGSSTTRRANTRVKVHITVGSGVRVGSFALAGSTRTDK